MSARAGPRLRLGARARATWCAHAWKAVTRQYHGDLRPVLRRFVARDATVFDAGAHAGQFSKLFARLAPAGNVYAFEPSPYALSILRLALRAHGLKNVRVVAAACGETPGALTLTTPVKASGAGSVRFGIAHLGGAAGDGARRDDVPVIALDAFMEENRIDRLDFIKADVEGWEVRMLLGAARTIARCRPPLLLELNDAWLRRAGDSLAGAWRLLSDWRYVPMEWTDGAELRPVPAPKNGEHFLWLPAERAGGAREASGEAGRPEHAAGPRRGARQEGGR